ncbi:hypothetical protein PoB_001891300 [Plakobranchus ocellatus]|uniref:Uncharacterized protein n=1 Tax=Plakobranchus ocellatus TaxID=259542 RepID=A0AAV3ZD83_9GAST|nr:hypothetical protein PoB_001891300 [Plakobranchus ocellatus]
MQKLSQAKIKRDKGKELVKQSGSKGRSSATSSSASEKLALIIVECNAEVYNNASPSLELKTAQQMIQKTILKGITAITFAFDKMSLWQNETDSEQKSMTEMVTNVCSTPLS